MSNSNFTNDKPRSCRFCYYYERHKCILDSCYYERPKQSRKPKSECDGCPYGRHSPCIGWCTKQLLQSLERGRTK